MQPIGCTPALSVTQKRRCSCSMPLVALYKGYMPFPMLIRTVYQASNKINRTRRRTNPIFSTLLPFLPSLSPLFCASPFPTFPPLLPCAFPPLFPSLSLYPPFFLPQIQLGTRESERNLSNETRSQLPLCSYGSVYSVKSQL